MLEDEFPESVEYTRPTPCRSSTTTHEAKQLIRDDDTLSPAVRQELLNGMWGRTDTGWFVICFGRNHELYEQGVGLVLWLDGVPFVINPSWVRPKKPASSKPDVVYDHNAYIQEPEYCQSNNPPSQNGSSDASSTQESD